MFNLSRYFSLTAGVGVLLVIVILSLFFRHLAENSMMKNQTQANLNITHSFANSTWHNVADFVHISTDLSTAEELMQQPEVNLLNRLTRMQMKGTNVVKVKIYNLKGLTIFSTDLSQIGEDKSQSEGFIQSKSGQVVSEISFRNEFYALENRISDRNLIATYIPVRSLNGNEIQAVFEVYSDVTTLVEEIDSNQIFITLGVSLALILLYLFLYAIIKRAHNLLIEHDNDRKEKESKVLYQAYHDSLTGLMNRNSFLECIQESMHRVSRHDDLGGLLFIDLDRFKMINDNLGHDAGDQLLCMAASLIQKAVRETDQTFRISGDEFLVILEDLNTSQDAAVIVQRILKLTQQPVVLEGHEIVINMSIGITLFSKKDADKDIEDIVKEADSAMYEAKKSGTNQFEFFSPIMTNLINERFSLEAEIRTAIAKKQFVPFYQVKVDSESLNVVGAESLLRWIHPEKGTIQPNVFIPLLEETGLICQVGDELIRTVCLYASSLEKRMAKPIRVSLNVSAIQFCRKGFVKTVEQALHDSGLSPELLELELTESMFMDNTEFAIEIMHELKQIGIKLSIDDFGTGYSSLSYLKKFPIDFLKIDRSFIKDALENNEDLAIIQSICALAHSLELKLTAEGVEHEQQVDVLRELGCDELQGFLFSKPLPTEKFNELLRLSNDSGS